MPRGQTPTPAERAQAELDAAQTTLDRVHERLDKKVAARDDLQARLKTVQDEVNDLVHERATAVQMVEYLRQHPLLGGTAPAAPQATHELVRDEEAIPSAAEILGAGQSGTVRLASATNLGNTSSGSVVDLVIRRNRLVEDTPMTNDVGDDAPDEVPDEVFAELDADPEADVPGGLDTPPPTGIVRRTREGSVPAYREPQQIPPGTPGYAGTPRTPDKVPFRAAPQNPEVEAEPEVQQAKPEPATGSAIPPFRL